MLSPKNGCAMDVRNILVNPTHPKSRLAISSLLQQYNEQKRRTLTLQRINYGLRNCESNNNNNVSDFNDCSDCDFDAMVDYEVKLNALPNHLLVTILGETFTKYHNQIKSISDDNPCVYDCHQNDIIVKQEVCDNYNDSNSIEKYENISSNNDLLLTQLNDQLNCIEDQEIIISNELLLLEKELEVNVASLRECINKCELLNKQFNDKNLLKKEFNDKKLELYKRVDEIKNNLSVDKNNLMDIVVDTKSLNSNYGQLSSKVTVITSETQLPLNFNDNNVKQNNKKKVKKKKRKNSEKNRESVSLKKRKKRKNSVKDTESTPSTPSKKKKKKSKKKKIKKSVSPKNKIMVNLTEDDFRIDANNIDNLDKLDHCLPQNKLFANQTKQVIKSISHICLDQQMDDQMLRTTTTDTCSANRGDNALKTKEGHNINLGNLNDILRNPEMPKSKLAINSILNQYNKHKCRSSTLARISHFNHK